MNYLAHAVFGDGADGRSGYLEGDPFAGFRNEKLFELQIRIEPTLGFDVGVGNMVAFDGTLSG